MPTDLPAGPDSPPTDELDSAEAALGVLQNVLHPIANDDWSKQTPCREFDIASLTDHLMNSIAVIGGAAGAELPERDPTDSVERQVVVAARPALDAWHRRGLDGTVKFGDNEAPARVMAGILSLEFLVHAWDYAAAMGRTVDAPESLADYVMGLAQKVITPQGRTSAGFDDPVDVPDDASSLD
ncbi:MAG: TIGR03086 family metal-binding protein, partial [Mycobacterium sp.]